jgi:hypothetical protein
MRRVREVRYFWALDALEQLPPLLRPVGFSVPVGFCERSYNHHKRHRKPQGHYAKNDRHRAYGSTGIRLIVGCVVANVTLISASVGNGPMTRSVPAGIAPDACVSRLV